MIGKRKRDTSVVSKYKKGKKNEKEETREGSPAPAESSAQDIFRKFFEAQFEPLEVQGNGATERDFDSGSDHDSEELENLGSSESEWSGIEGEGDDENLSVEVVEYTAPSTKADALMDKRARKAFMTAKPPSFATDLGSTTDRAKKGADEDDDKDTETMNLKNDLALQRLLKESHLLDSASDLAPTGKNRHKALDLRMQELGAKKSLYHQKNMPSSMRKGIKARATSKEDKRRKEARENGIILEKPAPKTNHSSGRRERGVGGPSIGKFAGGTLNLSQRDIAQVQSARRGRGKSRGRGRGPGRGRGRR
ncbi:hypothetical protein BJY01DRAFT_207329 [Aspergillus pseudoustus]|uniref:Uncharacterized protein n=1 Tax=Aspergillus pseudoustus TaxID=1810923 RepID=A0ABR4KKV2_9EURO